MTGCEPRYVCMAWITSCPIGLCLICVAATEEFYSRPLTSSLRSCLGTGKTI